MKTLRLYFLDVRFHNEKNKMSNEKDCTEISMGDNHNQLHCSEYFLPFYQLKTSFQIELNNQISYYSIYS